MSAITPPLFLFLHLCTVPSFHVLTFSICFRRVSCPDLCVFANSQIHAVSKTGWGICIEKDGDNVFYILFGKVFGGGNEKKTRFNERWLPDPAQVPGFLCERCGRGIVAGESQTWPWEMYTRFRRCHSNSCRIEVGFSHRFSTHGASRSSGLIRLATGRKRMKNRLKSHE